MSFIDTLKNIATGAAAGVLVVTALPIFGAIGAVTATGAAIGSVAGGLAGLVDSLED
jgi:hypothetical protein